MPQNNKVFFHFISNVLNTQVADQIKRKGPGRDLINAPQNVNESYCVPNSYLQYNTRATKFPLQLKYS